MKINDGGDDDESWKLTFVPFMKLLIITYFSKQTHLIFWTYYIQSDCDYSREMWNEDNGKSDIPRNLIVSRIWSWQEIYKARNTENKPKQIHTAVSRNLIVSVKPPLTLRMILDTLFVMKLSELSHIDWNVGGRANLSRKVSCDQFPMSWGPSKILQPLTGGCGTRLSIRRQDPNNYSDTETRCLVYIIAEVG